MFTLQATDAVKTMVHKRTCPSCKHKFYKAKVEVHPGTQEKTRRCPECSEWLYYRSIRGKKITILYDDKITVDGMVKIITKFLSLKSGFEWEPNITVKERSFCYEFLDWAEDFIGVHSMDIGMTLREFIYGFLVFILTEDEWWSEHFNSILMIKNRRSAMVHDYYESLARKRGVETLRSHRVKSRLQELLEEMKEL